jgi:hypothetical protein
MRDNRSDADRGRDEKVAGARCRQSGAEMREMV